MTPSSPGSAAPSSQPNAGFPTIPKYELLEEIGHGGMATVYRARDPRLNRDVAVKIIHRHLRENAEVATRFVAEARAAAKLRHPGIVEVYDVSNEDDSERFLIVELLRGATLRKLLLAHREMPAEVGACIVHQLCSALEHAHESGIIHRDIKPENVLVELPGDRERDRPSASSKPSSPGVRTDVDISPPPFSSPANDPGVGDTQQSLRDAVTPKGTHADKRPKEVRIPAGRASLPDSGRKRTADIGVVIKITDFGIAKILDAQGVTSTGQVLGSPAHMAPEQIEGGDVDARTDVFALGVLMYECLVGHLPFEGKNPAQVLRKVLDGIYPPADRERPSVGGRWSRILATALAREAVDRTPTPHALAEQISAELAAVGITDPKAEVTAYFAAPAEYAQDLHDKLVPKLLARGEAARKSGDVPKAAADFNRALALRPNDLAILKRVGSLATTASRRLLLRRAGAVVGATLVAGVAAFGVARLLKQGAEGAQNPEVARPVDPAQFDDGPMPTGTLDPAHIPDVDPPAPWLPGTTSGRVRAEPRKVVTPAPSGSALANGATRKVQIVAYPPGAQLLVDGSLQLAGQLELKPGAHPVELRFQGPCCKSPRQTTITVDDRDEQTFRLSLDINPATVNAIGPQGGTFRCSNNLTGATPSSRVLTMTKVEQQVTCEFTSADGSAKKKASFTIEAGKTATLNFN